MVSRRLLRAFALVSPSLLRSAWRSGRAWHPKGVCYDPHPLWELAKSIDQDDPCPFDLGEAASGSFSGKPVKFDFSWRNSPTNFCRIGQAVIALQESAGGDEAGEEAKAVDLLAQRLAFRLVPALSAEIERKLQLRRKPARKAEAKPGA